MTSTNMIERLAKLSAQRTARTDRLRDTTISLLAKLSGHCEVGDTVTVDGCTLTRGEVTGRNYYGKTWFLTTCGQYEDEAATSDLEESSDGYYGGDFDLPRRGARRADLIAFAIRSERFVSALVERVERHNVGLEAGAEAIERAGRLVG
jgi:hypothetical protein